MYLSLRRKLCCFWLLLGAMLVPAKADELALLNTAKLEVQEQLDAVSPGFLAGQKSAIKENYPLFIFVPGIIGSKLDRTTAAGTTTLWGAYDTSTPDLSIKDGDDDAVKPSILYDFKVGRVAVDVYASGIRDIMNAQLGIDLLKQFPYDWRKDNGQTAEKLNDWLCDEKTYNETKDREIRFIAHSMGGLVVKEWFRRYDGKPSCRVAGPNTPQQRPLNIKEVIFLGTPLFGSPKAIATLVNGFTLVAESFGGMLSFVSDALDKGSVSKALNEYGTLFPSVYQLLPIYHEHAPDCMDSYPVPGDKWPPHIADLQGSSDKFQIFEAKSWEAFGWPKTIPSSYSRAKYYEFLAKTLPEARTFLCRLAQYKFPAGVKVRYFASNSEKTDASFEISKGSRWRFWRSPEWYLDEVGRVPWTNGDGTVPMFVARNALARGLTKFEDNNATERHECRSPHSSLLSCTTFSEHIRDVITIAEQAQSGAATAYLQSHPNEKDGVLQMLAAANVYLPCKITGAQARSGETFSACPFNDEIRERTGVSVATLLAQQKSAQPSEDKAARIEVVAAMKGLKTPERIDAADNVALASFQAGDLNRGRATSVAFAGSVTAADDAFTPVKTNDKLIVTAPVSNTVVALNLDSNASIAWEHKTQQDPAVIPVLCCDTPSSGRLGYADGTVFKYEPDTTLVALDAQTGRELWKTQTGNPKKGEVGDTVPYVMNDKVFVGVSGEFAARGHVTAFDAKTGKMAWRSYATGPDAEILFDPQKTLSEGKPVGKDSGLNTWSGDQWKLSSGTQASKLVFDPELKLLYYVASGNLTFAPQAKELLPSPTIFARAIDTGEAKWIYQLRISDETDSVSKAELTLAEKKIGGKTHKILEYSDKAGNLLTLDREKGELLESAKSGLTEDEGNRPRWPIDPSKRY